MHFSLQQEDLEVKITFDQFKSTRIRVYHDGIVVKTNHSVKDFDVLRMLKQKEVWISKAYQRALKLKVIQDKVFYLNREMQLEIYESHFFHYVLHEGSIHLYKRSQLTLEKALQRFYLQEAENIVLAIFLEEAQRLSLKYQKIQFRRMKNAWGRCSSKKVITLNPNLMTCDPEFIRYVCIHELSHLTHMNHSKRFYELLKSYMPDYQNVLSLTPFRSYHLD